MSDEPIEWHDDGRITFRNFAGEDRTLDSPDAGVLWDMEDLIRDLLMDWSKRLGEAQKVEDPTEEHLEATNELARRGQVTDVLAPWYREVSKRLGSPFPDEVRSWPTYMLAPDLVRRVQDHWRFNPKASGSEEPDQ